ncbi:MAG: hypothetical protein PHD30_08430 [Paludibacter sp.]|nr:hypothetical protein [Paludibacter sp.]
MKKLYILLLILPLIFISCDFSGESNYTPNISIPVSPLKNNQDSLNIFWTNESGVFLMDTIQVGDTVRFVLRLDSYANRLTAFSVKHTPVKATAVLYPPVNQNDSIFNPDSDFEKGDFYLYPNYSILFFPFNLVAVEPSEEAKLEFKVVSDAQFDSGFSSNSTSIILKTPIKP